MSKLKILIVDDSQLNREILSCMLEDKYDICEAENGKQAVEILERCHKDFKLVLLDLIMPVMDGYQVLAVMKEKQWLDMLPVISNPRTILRSKSFAASTAQSTATFMSSDPL